MDANRLLILEVCTCSLLSLSQLILQKLKKSNAFQLRIAPGSFLMGSFLMGSFRPLFDSLVACEGWMSYTCSRCHVKLLILPPSVQKLVVAARFLGHEGIYFGGREERKWGND